MREDASWKNDYVSIPHGGLRTEENPKENHFSNESPSHTVGLEPLKRARTGRNKVRSPSHPVGLEQKFPDFVEFSKSVSPSHPVGSEQRVSSRLLRGGG